MVEEAEVAAEARKLKRKQRNAEGQGERSSLLLDSSLANFIEVLERTKMASMLHFKEITCPELCYGAAILERSSIQVNSDGALLHQFLRDGNVSFPEHMVLSELWQNLLKIQLSILEIILCHAVLALCKISHIHLQEV